MAQIKIEKFFIAGPAGALEALLESSADSADASLCALVCHPHPQFGGTMHNKVVFRAGKAAIESGLPTLRFNFRGTGKSEGEYAEGIGERDDVRATLDFLSQRFPSAEIVLMGFSFGAWVGLQAGAHDPRVIALIALGLPGNAKDYSFLQDVRKPKLIVQGTEDIYGPREEVERVFQSLPEPRSLHWVEGTDHFFTGRLPEVQKVIREFIEQLR